MSPTADAPLRRTFAQWYCLLAGASLLLAGMLGFAADGGFNTGSSIDGDNFIVFEVNGWHNLVHIGSGLLLLAAANYRPTAKSVAFAFGAVYGLVTLWGLVDGDEVLNIIPVNPRRQPAAPVPVGRGDPVRVGVSGHQGPPARAPAPPIGAPRRRGAPVAPAAEDRPVTR